jgi:nicotinamide mononucleotide adenylyltransferase
MEYGGTLIDNDIYVVQNLNKFRKFEMALRMEDAGCMGTQVLIAHKNARVLRLWLESYRQYFPDKWYYNAGCKPTYDILYKRPELVHLVKLLFGVHNLVPQLYKTQWKEWRQQYTIHLLIRHRSNWDEEKNIKMWPIFDEINIKDYPMTFGEMARAVYGIS